MRDRGVGKKRYERERRRDGYRLLIYIFKILALKRVRLVGIAAGSVLVGEERGLCGVHITIYGCCCCCIAVVAAAVVV